MTLPDPIGNIRLEWEEIRQWQINGNELDP